MYGGTSGERRTHLRVPATLELEYELPGVAPRPARLIDIGLGGSRMQTLDPPPAGAPVTVLARLPGARERSRLAATVRWSRGEHFGVAFAVLPAHDTLLIVDLMRVNLRSRPPPALEDA